MSPQITVSVLNVITSDMVSMLNVVTSDMVSMLNVTSDNGEHVKCGHLR